MARMVEQLVFRVSDDLKNRITIAAGNEERSVGEYLRRLLEKAVPKKGKK